MEQASRNDKKTINTTSVNVLVPNKRQVLSLRNSSTGGQILTIHLGEVQAVNNEGIVLSPGQAWVENTSEGYTCWSGSVQVISSADGGVLSYFER